MKNLKLFLAIIGLCATELTHAADINILSQVSGSGVGSGQFLVEDVDYAALGTGAFYDVSAFSYVRLGLSDELGMDYFGMDTEITVELRITPYDNSGNEQTAFNTELSVYYDFDGSSGPAANIADYRMNGKHKFKVKVLGVTINGSSGTVPDYVYLEVGFKAERYYELDITTVPNISNQLIAYAYNGSVQSSSTGASIVGSGWDDISFIWDYIDGAEYYELEWTWVDNYRADSLDAYLTAASLDFSEFDFSRNSTRIRTNLQEHKIPLVFAKGYLIYRVRAVGRWLEDTDKEKFGKWSTYGVTLEDVADWPDYVRISTSHEELKNWQYQATYAEDGKQKEVAQYFDGSLRNRQTVTRINSDHHSVIGETVYDNEGRGVIQILPVPMTESSIRFYDTLNLGSSNTAYNHHNFDWEDSLATCGPDLVDELLSTSGAAKYYSAAGHASDEDWQQYVPESNGYAFTQVEYTPDNTGRIRRQSGVGEDHMIGSGRETIYFYGQPSQEELNRLFGYKVGYSNRYKKNMVVDANGQVSISYLDAQGRVIATSLAGDNPSNLIGLPSETDTTYHGTFTTNLLSKVDTADVDTDLDNNIPFSTGRYGAINDGLMFNSQLPVVFDNDYEFAYSVTSSFYSEMCGATSGVSYPYVYDLVLSLRDDCGAEIFTANYDSLVGNQAIGSSTGDFLSLAFNSGTLAKGTYTLFKELTVNEAALDAYVADYLNDGNPCLLDSADFESAVSTDCGTTCEECAEGLGSLSNYLNDVSIQLGIILSADDSTYYTNIYSALLNECWSPCQAVTNCNVYRSAMLTDLKPYGQYGLSSSDPVSVYNTSNSLGTNYNWKYPAFPYEDAFGNPSKVSAYNTGGTNYQLADPTGNGTGTPELIDPEDLTSLSDFWAVFQPSWAASLLPYHPEYKLLQYAEAICDEVEDVATNPSGTIELSSEEFDAILRDEIDTYELAQDAGGGNAYDIIFVDGTNINFLFDQDPYFNHTYGIHTYTYASPSYPSSIDLTTLKQNLMLEALNTEYKNTGYKMLEFAYLTVKYGNTFTGTVSTYNTWDGVVMNSTAAELDAIWQTYKSYYISLKAEINQYLMDLYGYDWGMYNGCIGSTSNTSGIVGQFVNSNYYGAMTDYIANCWNTGNGTFLSNFPPLQPNIVTSLCSPLYDNKVIRVVRIDALFNASSPPEVIAQEIENDVDYGIWQSTGLCPLTIDMENFLNALGTDTLMLSSTTMEDYGAMVPDLYEGLVGYFPESGSTLDIDGSVNGSGDLQILFTNENSDTCSLTMPDPVNINGTLDWNDFGTGGSAWYIYGIYSSYPTGVNNDVQVVMLAGETYGTAEEYVVTYSSHCANLDTCQVYFSAAPQNDVNCSSALEAQFESDMVSFLNGLLDDGVFDNTSYNVTSEDYYTNSMLYDLIQGSTVNWYGQDMIDAFSIGDYGVGNYLYCDMEQPFPDPSSDQFVILSFNLQPTIEYSWQGNVFISYLLAGSPDTIINVKGKYHYVYDSVPGPIPLDCPCTISGDTTDFSPILSQLEVFFNDFIFAGSISNGSQPASYLALDDYTTNDLSASTISSYSLDDELSFDYGANTVTLSIANSGSSSADLLYVYGFGYDGAGEIYCTGYYSDSTTEELVSSLNGLVMFENWSAECDTCVPTAQVPVSCTDEYPDYATAAGSVVGAQVLSDSVFCFSQYAYIADAYEDYLSDLAIDSITDVNYLTIGEFGFTLIGYSNVELAIAVDAYAASSYSDETSVYWKPWHLYVNEVYLSIHDVCPAIGISSVFNVPDSMIENPCDQWENNVLAVNDSIQHAIYLEFMAGGFEQAYIEGAISTVIENFYETHDDKEYQYTLYYYDRAGNLIQTVPPKGVDRFETSDTDVLSNSEINDLRLNEPDLTDNTQSGTGDFQAPEHTLETRYAYNSLNQLVYQITPDGGESRFAYDALGRLVMSQNAKQYAANQFSYTRYDALGRVVEVGEMTLADYSIDELGRLVDQYNAPATEVNSGTFPGNLSTTREEVTHTIYDELYDMDGNPIIVPVTDDPTYLTTVDVPVEQLFGNDYAGDNTRNRIVAVLYQDVLQAELTEYNSASFYDYDVHGNVKHLIQVINTEPLRDLNQHIKHFNYTYDLVSGNVNEVVYQEGYTDQYMHRYTYDADNRIVIAETSTDGVQVEKDAKYFYYDHGPLARTEIGDAKVQATDFAYTIQGWLKAVNGEEIDEATMMGNDGDLSTVNASVARDAFGFSLNYFQGDYASADTTMLNYSPGASSGQSLYNGNIRSMFTSISDNDEMAIGTHHTRYGYDQLNRIKSMEGLIAATGLTSYYSSEYGFDANGNLRTLKRYAPLTPSSTAATLMDDFEYKYEDAFNGGENNRLSWVDDLANSGGASQFDSVDIDGSMNADNYVYDEIGQLVTDVDEGIDSILWKVTNKVQEVRYSDGRRIHFDYDPMGNRIAKHVKESGGDSTSTYYFLDAQGNQMGIYTYMPDTYDPSAYELFNSERPIYGSSRLGLENVTDSEGNVSDSLGYLGIATADTLYFENFSSYGVGNVITLQTLPMPSGFPDWEMQAACANDTTQAVTGGEVLSVTDTCATQHDFYFPTIPGREYTFSANFGLTDATYFFLEHYIHAGAGAPGTAITSSVLGTPTSSYSYTFLAQTNWQRISLKNIGNTSQGGVFTVDNILLTLEPISLLSTVELDSNAIFTNFHGDKRYELANHLGNVLEVITDRKLPVEGTTGSGGYVDYFLADVVSYSDYYPYGMLMPDRHGSVGDYRYGFNGMEADDEVKNLKGTSYDFGARLYDPRVGRWLTIDPLAFKQPDQSPYKAMFNNPIFWNDPDGRTEYETTIFYHRDGSFEKVTRKISDNVISNGNSRRVFEYNGNSGFNRDYTDFYDYRQVTIYREREDGTFSVEFIKDDILVDNGVKRTRLGIFGKGSKYDPNAHWTGEGSGGKQNGGYRLTSKSGGASPTKQRSLTAAEEREIEALLALLGTKGGSLGGKGQDIIKDLSNLIEKAADVKDEYGDNSSSQDIPGNSNTMSNTVIWRMKNGKYRGSGDFATDKEKLEGDTLIGSYPEKHITITPAGDTLQGTPQQNGLNK